MPNILLPLESIDQSVSRPIYIDMIKQVQKLTNIDDRTKIFFPGDIQRMHTPGSTIDDQDRERFAIFNTERYTFIEIEDDFDEASLAATAVERQEHPSVFCDEKLGVSLTPVYATTNVTINITYRCPSKNEAQRWRDEVRTRVSKNLDINLHKVTYHYMLPLQSIVTLKEIHEKREAKVGYNQNFQEYVTGHADRRLTLIGGTTGKDQSLAISETQTRIQGIFTWDALPEKAQRDETTGTWSITFGYKFNFEKPIELHMRYPVMVHNQLLEADFIEFTDKAYDVEKDTKNFSKSYHAMHSFELGTLMASRSDTEAIVRIPSYDDYVIPDVIKGTGTSLIALCEIDDNKRTFLNLEDLGDYAIDQDIMDFIKGSEYPYICKPYKSIICVSVYRNGYLTSNADVSCSHLLNIASSVDLDLRNQYRVRVGICVDITLLDIAALKRLQNYPKAMVKIIGAMNELLKNNPDFIELGKKSRITDRDFSYLTSFLSGYRIPLSGGNYYGPGINTKDLFKDIDPRVVENYRRNAITRKGTMNLGAIAYRLEDQ